MTKHATKHQSEAQEPNPSPITTQWVIDAVYRCGQFVPLTPLQLGVNTPITFPLVVCIDDIATSKVQTIEAIFEDGVIRPLAPINLPDDTPIRLQIALHLAMLATLPQSADIPDGAWLPSWSPETLHPTPDARSSFPRSTWKDLRVGLDRPLAQRGLLAMLTRFDLLLLGMVMVVYALVRLVGLTRFPIFFFSDEAIHTNLAMDLIHKGLRDDNGVFLPPYFRNVDKWNLSLSVYLQGISAWLFGKSVLVNRGTSAIITLLAGIAVALTLRLVFRLRFWWIGPLVLAALPVWFLHSRTSFETVMMVSFYACFLCTYLIYRYHDPRYVIAAIVFGAATFYSYANGQGVMFVSALLLLLSDLRYHIRTFRAHPRLFAVALVTTALAAIQYIRFRVLYPDSLDEHLRVMNSIWVSDALLQDKLSNFAQNYLQGLSPIYWFTPNNGVDLDRHTFKDWGNFPLIFLPLLLFGLWTCLRQWRSSAHRAVLIAILAAPFSASLAFIHNYRVLAMVVPAALLVCLGFEQAAGWLINHHVRASALSLGCAILLVGMNVTMLRVALIDGPTWYDDYTLYGMQYGASQLFPAIAQELESSESDVEMSSDWANNPDAFVPFFLSEEQQQRVVFRSPEDYLIQKLDLKPTTIYALQAQDYDTLQASGKLVLDQPFRVIRYPNGQPGFLFTRMHYVDNIDAILAAELEVRRQLVDDSVTIDGQTVQVKHSVTDLGSMADMLDNDHGTLIRGRDVNPLVFEFTFPEPRTISGIGLDFWRVDLQLTVTAVPDNGDEPQIATVTYRDPPEDPHIDVTLPNGPVRARTLRIELLDMNADTVAKIHVAGLQLH